MLVTRLTVRKILPVLFCVVLVPLAGTSASATELKPQTAAAFNQYIHATEAHMQDATNQGRFLFLDDLPESRRVQSYQRVQRGEIYVQALHSLEDSRSIRIPSGLIHHWVAVVFVPNATLIQALDVLQDYEHQKDFYKPMLRDSKLIDHNGNNFKVFLQFSNTAGATIVLNANFDITATRFSDTQYQLASRSMRIAELANPGKPDEHELPVGNDRGFMWRLYTYWRIEEKDGGVYIQNESVALSRTVPAIIAWLVNPFIKGIPRSALVTLLSDTRTAVKQATSAKPPTSQ